jgi:hypothetical protein
MVIRKGAKALLIKSNGIHYFCNEITILMGLGEESGFFNQIYTQKISTLFSRFDYCMYIILCRMGNFQAQRANL